MKGQYRIITEVMIFAIGIIIASFVFLSFQGVKEDISNVAINNQLTSIAKLVSSGVIKSIAESSVVKIKIPETISGHVYIISVVDQKDLNCDLGEDCSIKVFLLENPDISASQQLFNISQNYNIKGNIISTAEYIEIIFDKVRSEISIERFR